MYRTLAFQKSFSASLQDGVAFYGAMTFIHLRNKIKNLKIGLKIKNISTRQDGYLYINNIK